MAQALIVVDLQEDFTPPDGALAVPGGHEIVGRVNELAVQPAYGLVVATRDWHPPDHASFAPHGGPWPVHCVQGTPGAELHGALDRSAIHEVVDKGQDRETEGYSGFQATRLRDLLRGHRITAVTVCGLATDYCVRHTALDALRDGLEVAVAADAVRGVDVTAGDSERALRELAEAGAVIRR
ncbi:MAG TPA: nicotinamidase [Baekduia sp.]|nr:nicotinamidase [Baekduia sp.]